MPIAQGVVLAARTGTDRLSGVTNSIGSRRHDITELPVTYSMSAFASPTDSVFSEDASLFDEELVQEEEVQVDHSLNTESPEELDAALDAMRDEDANSDWNGEEDLEDWRNPQYVYTILPRRRRDLI